MKKRVFIIHGWGGSPNEHWLPWLADELQKQGYEVSSLAMPNPSNPIVADWVNHLAQSVGEVDEGTYFVGHSIGCQTIIRYLETQVGKKAGGCVLVAAWFKLENLQPDEELIAHSWERNDIDYQKVMSVTKNITVINSSNDDYGAVEENKRLFEERLSAHVIILENMGHFTQADGVTQLPPIIEAINKFSQS
jgi:uncharacterized protein